MSSKYDFIILGSGTTAFAAACKASSLGARVLMVEQSKLGGTCVNWGCVPSKTLIHKAKEFYAAVRSAPFGINLRAEEPDYALLMQAKIKAVEDLRREHYQQVLDADERIEVLRGHGRFLSPRELQVGAEVLVHDKFLIATGGTPRSLRLPGLVEAGYLNSYSALNLPAFPASLLIIGGGVVAVEMGQMFARFGTRVTIVERGDRLLKEFDARLVALFAEILHDEGVELIYNFEATEVRREGEQVCLHGRTSQGEGDCCLRAERILLAVGTAPASTDIGLEETGVARDEGGFISVDEEMRTNVAGIWAAGDVTGPPLIAPSGAREGEVAAENMLNPAAHRRIDHRTTPMAVFVDPELAMVGISSAQARAAGKAVVETFLPLDRVAKAHVMGGRRGGFVLCAERGSGRILGAQALAPRAADLIHEATLAVRFGLSVHDLAETVHVYPTIADGLRLAAVENLRHQP
ncbi:dihydrolipoyl dehydrogenase family protein [Geoalkalibacter halelectricus]|uniref:NAD(P)/FAD-dependent oxidoreductase n=1 Tax=Geoalkalibacter halelectricus TaxID=2847045 RepID=A0ABY5ZHG8_9BACT|nr:NAD(P)/FAD-dependent oxidoreductase [Geoalkalibacter halelectricus]MDO3378178.1 NAD(P)/FAD-dependent oxidoreductase [Geoalkalibacter halelectricus]UWZ78023.1 NAD(P)/FAD-dependent oxidoreductase [Geoalkalibacter halelectricus]